MKWIFPAVFAAVFFGGSWWCMNAGWTIPAAVLGLVMFVLAVTAIFEFGTHYSDEFSVIYERRMRAKYSNSVVFIAEALKGLHSESAKILMRFVPRATWDVKIDMDKRDRTVILHGTNVQLGFAKFVLERSKDGRLFSKNNFSDGACEWDPYRQVTDREQYKELEDWLAMWLVVARPFNNVAAEFLPPWTPRLVMEVMGIQEDGAVEYWEPQVRGTVKRLTDVEKKLPMAAVRGELEEPPLSADDLARIKALQDGHDAAAVFREKRKDGVIA